MEIVKSVFQSEGKRYQLIRYCTAETLTVEIHYEVYYLLQEHETINSSIVYAIGYMASFVCNSLLASYFAFRSNPSLKRALGFEGNHLVNYLIYVGLSNLFLYLSVDQEIIPLCMLTVTVPTNLLMLRFVFKHKKGQVANQVAE